VASFYDFALVCQSLGQTSSRLQIAQSAGEFLATLGVNEAAIAARFMVGRALPQDEEKRLQVSGRAIWRVVAELVADYNGSDEIFAAAVDFGEAIEILLRLRAAEPPPILTLGEIEQCLMEIASIEGAHSRRRKLEVLRGTFARANALEGKYLAKILIREMRHGMSEGLMLEAIARMAGCSVGVVRRAHMLDTDLGRLVQQLHPGRNEAALARSAVVELSGAHPDPTPTSSATSASPSSISPSTEFTGITRPIRPMLAAPAASVTAAYEILGGSLALEYKLDGARAQIHCGTSGVHVFSRRMNDISVSLPEVSEMVAPLREQRPILDGEVIAVGARGEPLAFQELMRRFGRVRAIEQLRAEQPIRLFIFDLIAIDGHLLIDTVYQERFQRLAELAAWAGLQLAPRIVPTSVAEGQEFYARAIGAGYEGVVAKGLASLYTPGARGRGWLKIKNSRTLDLVIVAADWGYGRRHGWLSNYHLAARDPATGQFMEVGKTFKGLTDADFEEMTRRLQALKIGERGATVFVRPQIVVEVAYSDIQRSPRYAAGMALRFARILNVRFDKAADQADTIETLTADFDRQLVKPAAPRQ
jgi:DNA ligase-1